MVYWYSIDPLLGIAVVTMRSSIRGDDLIETLYAVKEDARWRPGFHTIWDGSGIEDVRMDWKDVEGLVQVQRDLEHLSGRGTDVIVVTRAVDLALARAYATMVKGGHRDTHVVSTMSDAYAILDAKHEP